MRTRTETSRLDPRISSTRRRDVAEAEVPRAWVRLFLAAVAVIMLVTARRYALPLDVPYKLEPYRVVLAVLVGLILFRALVRPVPRLLDRSFLSLFALLFFVSLLSVVANIATIQTLGLDDEVLGQLAQLLTVILVAVLARLVLRTKRDVHLLLATLVICGAFVGLLALIERATGDHQVRYLLDQVLPIAPDAGTKLIDRGSGIRAYGSAQHPIVLGVEMLMLVPVALYLIRHSSWPRGLHARSILWCGCAVLLLGGMVASVSRSTVVALGVVVLVGAVLRPSAVRAVLPVAIGALLVLSFATPGTTKALVDSFNPEGGLVVEQQLGEGTQSRSSGRLADIPLALDQVEEHPVLGAGFATRQTDNPYDDVTLIFDNAYLSQAVDVGLLGLLASEPS